MKIITIAGGKRQGKDTTATIIKNLLEQSGYKVEIMYFADDLKDIACNTLNMNRHELEVYKNRELPVTHKVNARQFLQRLGDSIKDLFGEYSLFNKFKDKIRDIELKGDIDFVIVPDRRFTYEILSDKDIKIKVHRYVDGEDNHISEKGIYDSNVTHINNTGSTKDLEQVITNWLFAIGVFNE